SLIPSIIISHLTPACPRTSRSKRASALTPAPSASTRFPEIPRLRTDNFGTPVDERIRAASTLGQLRSASFVDVAPSVMESPNATIAAVSAGAMTSTDVIQYQERVVVASFSIGEPVTLPCAM